MGSNHQHDGAGLLGLQQVDRARPTRPRLRGVHPTPADPAHSGTRQGSRARARL